MSVETISPAPELDKVALFDIDGTLIDNDYEVTSTEIYPAIEYAIEAGWQVGLSSDTPYDRMKEWHDHFGANGPIIAEKGAHVVDSPLSETDTSEIRSQFLDLRDRAVGRFKDEGIKVWEGDPTILIRSGEPFPYDAEVGEVVVLLNSLRRHSFGYFIRVIGDGGTMHKSEADTLRLHNVVRSFYPDGAKIHEDINHDFGLVIVSNASMNKRVGSLALLQSLGLQRFAMVGNSFADYVGSDIAIHFAVGDATPEYKDVADVIATEPVTAGAAESLDLLTGRKAHKK